MSQFSDSPHAPGPAQESHTPHTSIFGVAGAPAPKPPVSVSNLTRNLMSGVPPDHAALQHAPPPEPLPRHPPLYSASLGTPQNRFLPGESGSLGPESESAQNCLPGAPVAPPDASTASATSSFSQSHPGFFPGAQGTLFTPTNTNMSYIPLGHNTPTVVLTSYTSNYSYTPLLHSVTGQDANTGFLQLLVPFPSQSGFMSSSYKAAPGVATTTVSMDSANPSLYGAPSLYRPGTLLHATGPSTDHYANLLPNTSFGGRALRPGMARMPSDRVVAPTGAFSGVGGTGGPQSGSLSGSSQHTLENDPARGAAAQAQARGLEGGAPSAPAAAGGFFPGEPDHYMTYHEYLAILNKRDAQDGESVYDEHLNIVEYPVNDLITMLACLLTKIIEANDKLHPNHFDNTIAIRQKLKEEKKLRRMQRDSEDHMETVGGDENASSDDEEDELKNRYLANVLAFHGTNIPGISLHAYLTRVLKYCPVTNEVFLSLLVYFDRIAKKANNLRRKKKEDEGDEGEEGEQLFVMDSYNIHRLIILGITVSSKFFSDIFYKNLRYAKVGGLPLEELNYLELQFLLLLDFKLMISVEDLQNYGDLLHKFWKREQLANELVNGAKNEAAV